MLPVLGPDGSKAKMASKMILQKNKKSIFFPQNPPKKRCDTIKNSQKKDRFRMFFVSMVCVCVKRQVAVDIWLKGFFLGSL